MNFSWIPKIRIGTRTNYSEFEADGTYVAKGNATTFRDELGDITKMKTVGTRVTLNDSENTIDMTSMATTSDYAWTSYQLNHYWLSGSSIFVHIHWLQASNATPNFLIQYRWQRNGQAKTTGWTNLKCNTDVFSYSSGTLCQISSAAAITPPANYSISDILQIRLIRDTNNTSTVFAGADPYSGTVSVMSVDIHIECDTLGSRTQYTK